MTRILRTAALAAIAAYLLAFAYFVAWLFDFDREA